MDQYDLHNECPVKNGWYLFLTKMDKLTPAYYYDHKWWRPLYNDYGTRHWITMPWNHELWFDLKLTESQETPEMPNWALVHNGK